MLLDGAPAPLERCPSCGVTPFRPFLRGEVQRWPYSWRMLWLPIGTPGPYVALICTGCKEIVGYEVTPSSMGQR